MKINITSCACLRKALLALVLTVVPIGGFAQDLERGWFLRSGPLGVIFDPSATVSIGGGVVPGGSADADDNLTLSFDIGYQFNDRFSMTFTGGIPPKADLHGSGTLSGAGYLGSATYAPAVLAAQYWIDTGNPKFRPYIGAGVNYTVILDTDDGAIGGLDVDNAWAPVLQVGFESALNDRFSFYADVKKLWLSTNATGTVGGAPASADVTLNPWLVGTGLSYRF